MAKAPFPIDPVLTGIALEYKNRRYIADSVLPRMEPPLEKEEFTYHKFRLAEGFLVPNTLVGRKSQPNEVEFNADRLTDSTVDFGLDDVIPANDMANAPVGYDPTEYAAMKLADLVALDREQRVSGTVFAAATYPAANKATLAGNSQWSDYVNSNPVTAISDALDIPVIRPNVMVVGRAVFTKLASHPKVVSAVLGNDGSQGRARPNQIAELFELDEILVGESFVNTAKKGQTATMARVWGKHCSLIYRNPLARGATGEVTFGFTAQFGGRVAGRLDEPKVGLRGSTRVRVGESVKEVIAANDVAYFFENAVA